jgi:hypothetical protein
MVTARKQTTKTTSTASKTRATASEKPAKEMTPQVLAQRIKTAIDRCYKVQISDRNQRTETKVGYAVREKLGLDVLAQLRKQGKYKNGNTANFWREFNNSVFPKILGEPTELKYPVRIVAQAIALLYDSISTDRPIEDLVEFNAQSLNRRNGNGNGNEETVGDLDDIEDDFDSDDEEIDDLLEEAAEDEEEDEEFELEDED